MKVDDKLYEQIYAAVLFAMNELGIEKVKQMSCFGSNEMISSTTDDRLTGRKFGTANAQGCG